MSQRKMLQVSMGALLLLLPWIGGLVIGEISNDFSQCRNFFYKKIPPQGITAAGYQPICQNYKNLYRFASLYHREHRAPLYSAYNLSCREICSRPKTPWKYEPQLAFNNFQQDMQPFPVPRSIYKRVFQSQAVLQDYANSGYTKGHLNPSMHQQTYEDREATFTLTNIVPQREGSNKGPWNFLERKVLERFKKYCEGSMYVITGVMPYKSGPRSIKNRVSVPEYMWSAYCCPSYKSNLPNSVRQFFPTYAAVGRNDPKSGGEIVSVTPNVDPNILGYDVREMSLETLEGFLRTRLQMPEISLFNRQCGNTG